MSQNKSDCDDDLCVSLKSAPNFSGLAWFVLFKHFGKGPKLVYMSVWLNIVVNSERLIVHQWTRRNSQTSKLYKAIFYTSKKIIICLPWLLLICTDNLSPYIIQCGENSCIQVARLEGRKTFCSNYLAFFLQT